MADTISQATIDFVTAGGTYSVALLWNGTSFLTFDVCVSRKHGGGSDVTEHPVEQGANISDHVRPQLDTLSVDAFVTMTPLVGGVQTPTILSGAGSANNLLTYTAPFSLTPGGIFGAVGQAVNSLFGVPGPATAQLMTFPQPFDTVTDTLATLRALKDTSQVVAVITPEHTYNSMILQSFELVKDHETGTGARIAMQFKQLIIVQTVTVAAPVPAVPRGNSNVNKGTKAPVSPSGVPSSVLLNGSPQPLLNALGIGSAPVGTYGGGL